MQRWKSKIKLEYPQQGPSGYFINLDQGLNPFPFSSLSTRQPSFCTKKASTMTKNHVFHVTCKYILLQWQRNKMKPQCINLILPINLSILRGPYIAWGYITHWHPADNIPWTHWYNHMWEHHNRKKTNVWTIVISY